MGQMFDPSTRSATGTLRLPVMATRSARRSQASNSKSVVRTTGSASKVSQRKFPNWDGREPDCTVQEKNLRMAKAGLEHAEDQVVKCRQWASRLPKLVDEIYSGSGRRLANFVEADVPRALADLVRRIGALDSYSGLQPDYAPTPTTSSAPASPPTAPKKDAGETASGSQPAAEGVQK